MSGSTITGTTSTTVTLNSGSYLSPLTVTTGGAITVAIGYGITSNSYGTLINDGTIISGNTRAIGLYNGGSVTNSGVILGSTDGIHAFGGALTLANSGSIAGGVGGHGISIYTGYVTNAPSGQIYGGSFGAYFYAPGGTLNNAGTITAGTSGTGVSLLRSSTLINAGTIAGGAHAVDFQAKNTYLFTYSGYSGGVLIVDPGAVFNGSVTSVASLQNTLDLASGSSAGTLNMGGSFSGFGTINIDTGATWTLEGNAAELASRQTITGFTAGDTIDLSGVTATSADFSAGTLSLYATGGGLLDTLTLAEPSGVTSASFTLMTDATGTGTDIVLCFYPGTRIATPEGDAAVEDLGTGDAVLTANGPLPVRWIGRREVSTRFADKMRSLPVRITAGALGDGLPRRDLLVSPDHALFLDGILVQAGALVDGVNILREHNVPEQFSYYHIEFASHELLWAEWALTESFVDNVERMHFHNWDAREAPAEAIAEMAYPRAKSARQVPMALRARLAGAKAG
jgi:hypothetical protein